MTTTSRLLRLRPTAYKPLTSLLTPPQASSYHSYNHPPPPGPFGEVETTILSSALPYIPLKGFTPETFHLGAQSAGYLDASTNLFPSGAFSLVHYYLYTQRNALQKHTSIINPSIEAGKRAPGVGQKVKALTWARLIANQPVVHKLPEALALMSLAGNIRPSLKELSALSDEIWFLAGDVSVDSSWYTKRASLAAIYGSTEVFMTRDTSEGFRETREFLDRRFEDSRTLGEAVGNITQWIGFTAGAAVNVLRSKGVRI